MLMQNSDSHFISIAHSFKYLVCFDIGFIEIRGTNHKLKSGGVVYIFVNKIFTYSYLWYCTSQ